MKHPEFHHRGDSRSSPKPTPSFPYPPPLGPRPPHWVASSGASRRGAGKDVLRRGAGPSALPPSSTLPPSRRFPRRREAIPERTDGRGCPGPIPCALRAPRSPSASPSERLALRAPLPSRRKETGGRLHRAGTQGGATALFNRGDPRILSSGVSMFSPETIQSYPTKGAASILAGRIVLRIMPVNRAGISGGQIEPACDDSAVTGQRLQVLHLKAAKAFLQSSLFR
jgi:hypothetical protein